MTSVVTQTPTTARDKMLQRVLNLRARAEDDASSEAEMNTALTMAMKLMDSYNIEEAELAIAEAEGRIELEIVEKVCDTSVLKGKKKKHKVLNVIAAIANFTETKAIINRWGEILFTGHRPDTELANYLIAVIKYALDSEFDNYKRNVGGRIGYGAKASFQSAMANRISNRLRAMASERDGQRAADKRVAQKLKIENGETASSTAIVVSDIAEQKATEVSDKFRKAYPRLRSIKSSYQSNNSTAHGAGIDAGSRVNLGRAVTSSGSAGAIAS